MPRSAREPWAGSAAGLAAAGLLALAAAAARADQPPLPILGVMTHFAQGWSPSLAETVAQGGIGAVRDELYWQEIETSPGNYAFPPAFDRYMAALQGAHVQPLIELDFANTAYDRGLTPYTHAGFEAYANYGVQVLRHYGGQIGAVEIWNEYNGSFCTGPAASNRSQTYAAMLKVAYKAIKAERPDVTVAGASTSGLPLPYLERLFQAGALDSMDAVSVHPYRYDSPPEGIELDIRDLQNLIAAYSHSGPKPVWVTEIGWATKAAAAKGDLAIDEQTQAEYLVRAYALLLSAGVERIYWYLFRDDAMTPTMGLVRDDAANAPKASFEAMRTMIAQIGGARFARRDATPPDLYSLVFNRDSGEHVRVVWSVASRTIDVPPSCKIVDMLGNPVLAGPVTLGASPVYIEGPLFSMPLPDPSAPRVVADSVRGFSKVQGSGGWNYGMFVGPSTDFTMLSSFTTTDWVAEWYSQYPYLSLTNVDQHPSESSRGPVAAVRRWTSTAPGTFAIHARFQCGQQGDGVTVRVYVNGEVILSEDIGGPNTYAVATCDASRPLSPGDHVDFAVFPGPNGNANFDATQLAATISEVPQP